MNPWRAFVPDLEGVFVSRPNRFAAVVDTAAGRFVAHCPNPGRLREILLPGTPVLLERSRTERKTPLTLVAALHDSQWIPLASARANQAAAILLPHLFPDSKLRPEYSRGESRFDFFIETPGVNTLVEVKSCTLSHHGVAMFPDAPSLRAVKHLHHLARESEQSMVLFTTYFPDARVFIPHLHTDPDFASAAVEVKDKIEFRACVWSVDREGWGTLVNPGLKVDLMDLGGISYKKGLALSAWESGNETILVWAQDFEVWRKVLSVKAKVRNLVGEDYTLTKVNDLRVYSEFDLSEKWKKLSASWGQWIPGSGNWLEMRVPGRILDSKEFWNGFLELRHCSWRGQ